MLSQEDRILGELLVRRGVLSPERLAEALAGRQAADPNLSLSQYLVAKSMVGAAHLATIPGPDAPISIGDFTIVREIGRGGMGIVYEAIQHGLDRRIALKVLPVTGPGTGISAERFAREARAIGKLRHPNIVTVYDTGVVSGYSYIAMDLLDGGSVEDLVNSGPTEPLLASTIVLAVAGALEAAHAAGLIHRDIKPSNILLDHKRSPKLSDFGLVHDEAAARLTIDSSVLGTPSFMSPEQARGERPRAGHDVYSLSAVLYALLVGQPPYEGDLPSAVLARVLTCPPKPIEEAMPGVPRALAAIVSKGLARRPGDRYESAAELAEDLRRFVGGSETRALRAKRQRAVRSAIILGVFATAAIGVLTGLMWRSSERGGRVLGSTLQPTEEGLRLRRVTAGPGVETTPSLSPDGSLLAYASEVDGDWDIYLEKTGAGNAVNVTADVPERDSQPSFSPDGESIAFRSERDGGGIYVEAIDSGMVRRVAAFGFHPSWSPDGRRIAVSTEGVEGVGRAARSYGSEIWILDVVSGEHHRIVEADAVQPAWSPSGSRLAFWGRREGRSSLWTVRSEGEDPVECVPAGEMPRDPAWLADGSAIVLTSRRAGVSDLWAVPIDETTGECGDSARILAQSVTESHQSPAVSRDGRSIAVVNWVRRENVSRLIAGRDAAANVVVLSGDRRVESAPEISADGEWLVISVQDGPSDLVVVRKDMRDRRSITNDVFEERTPRWSPDGRWIVFSTNRTGNFEIWRIRPDGTDAERLTVTAEGSATAPVWSPDGLRLVYSVSGKGILEIDPADAAPREPRVILPSDRLLDAEAVPRAWSPDGRRLLLVSRARKASLLDLITGEETALPEKAQGGAWTPAGELWLTAGSELKALDPATGSVRVISTVAPRKFSATLSFDRRTGDAYTTVVENEADIWLMDLTGVDGAEAAGTQRR